jgi:hypothetical protein
MWLVDYASFLSMVIRLCGCFSTVSNSKAVNTEGAQL